METENEISLQEIMSILWKRAWIIGLCCILGAGIGFSISYFWIQPTYMSRMSMYVNNNKERTSTDLNINDINASQELVSTYIEILKSNTVLGKVIEDQHLKYSNNALRAMILASSVNGTEILQVEVRAKDPIEAANIANALAKVAPAEIIRVVKAGDVQLIDEAIPQSEPISPNISLNTLMGGLLGLILSILIFLVLELLDNHVKSLEDLRSHYQIPVLGDIPDIIEASKYRK